MNQHHTDTFKDSTNLTKWTKWFLYLNIIIAVVSIGTTSFEYKFLSDIKIGAYTSSELILADSTFNDTLQNLMDIVQLLVFVVSGILILRWIYITSYNAHQLSTSKMKFTPGWSIGWYFIPIFNLWKPYQAMKEIWKVSENPTNWEKQSVPSMLRWWWFFWILDGFFSKLSFQFKMRASEINELMRADLIYLISDFTFIILSFSLLTIIDEIYKMQISNYSIKDNFTGGDYKDKEFNEEDVNIAIVFSATNNSRWELLHANLDKSKQYLDNSGWIKKDNYLYVIPEANDDGLYQYVQLGSDSNDFPVLRAGFMSYSETLDDSTKPLDSLMINFDDEIAFNNIVQSITKSLEKISTSHDVLLEFVLFELDGLVLGGEVGKKFVENSGFGTNDYVGFSTKSDEAEVLFDTFILERSRVAKMGTELFIKLSISILDNIMQEYSLGKYELKETEKDIQSILKKASFCDSLQYYQKSAEFYQEAVDQNNAVAQYNLGYMYEEGQGVEQDYQKAIRLYQKSADQGYDIAQNNLGIMYHKGKGVEQDYQKAAKLYQKSADQDNVFAQVNLGNMYSNGEGVAQDYKKAVELFLKATNQGHATAQYSLGIMYDNGKGVEQDYQKATELYRKAADQGYADSQNNLGNMYEHGEGVELNYKEAEILYRKASEQGHALAQKNLEIMYAKGMVVKQGSPITVDQNKVNAQIFFNSKGIDSLYHFTDVSNLESIIKNGGLYSWKGLENIRINASLSSNELSRQLDTQRNLQNYIRLSFTDYHPMSTKVEKEDGKNLVWLKIDLDVALWENTLFSDINATDNNVTVNGDFDFLKTLDFDIFRQRYNNLDILEKKKYQAEILVKDFLPIKYIKNINSLKAKYLDWEEIPF